MATVPYSPNAGVAPTTSPGGQPMNIQADASMFGGQVGAAEQSFGQDLARVSQNLGAIAISQQERTNHVVSNDAYNQLQDSYFNLTYGDPKTQKPGFYGMSGRDAMTAYQPTAARVNELRDQLSAGLPNDAARLRFEESSRRLQHFTLEQMGRHYDSQFNRYTQSVNDATQKNSVQAIAADYNDDNKYQQHLDMALRAAVQGVQDKFGMDASPELINAAVTEQTTKAVITRAEAWGIANPTAALEWLKTQHGKIDETHYGTLYRHLEHVANGEEDTSYVNGLLGGARPQGGAGTPRMVDAIRGTEGSGATSVSPKGARGQLQVMPATFRGYARPGESFEVEADREAVGQRIIGDLEQKYPNDPARVAVAYFSGPGNVSSPGSQNPWIENRSDGNITVSQYVERVQGRLKGGGPRLATSGGQPVGATPDDTPVVPAAVGGQQPDQGAVHPDRSALVQQVIRENPNPARQAARLSKLEHGLSVLNIANETERNDLKNSLPDLQAAALDGKDITIPEANIRRLLPPSDAARSIEALQVAQHAGLVLKGVQWGSREQVEAAWQDLSSGMGPISTMIRHGGRETMGPAGVAEGGTDKDSPEAYRMRKAILEKFEQMVGKRQKILKDDPAAYASSSPTVVAAAQAVQAAGNDVAKSGPAIQAYVNATLTTQAILGVPEGAQHVLPLAQAQGIAGKLENADNVQQSLRQMKDEWGEAWPKVFADLVTLGKLPGGYLSVAALDDPREAALLARGLNEQSKSGKEWNDILGNAGGRSVAQGIRDAVRNDNEVMRFERSLKDSGSSLHQIDGILSAIETLAFAKRFYNQDGNAAQSAIKAFTDRYSFMPGSSSARVPKDNYAAVQANAYDALQDLTESSVRVPPAYDSSPSAPMADNYIHALKVNPTWVTSPREDALWLMGPDGGVVRTKDGKPFAIPFNKPAPTTSRLRLGTGALEPGYAVP